jgi:HrpA-like RNA helicase
LQQLLEAKNVAIKKKNLELNPEELDFESERVFHALEILVLPLYSALGPREQEKIFRETPKGTRKFVLTTIIAETSLTIPGIKYVVDSGLQKTKFFFQSTEILKTTEISKECVLQRRGRAGRQGPGFCYHLYPDSAFRQMEESKIPEICRVDFAHVYLQLRILGHEAKDFDFIDRPATNSIVHAKQQLFRLGAMEASGRLTEKASFFTKLPISPFLSNLLFFGKTECPHESLVVASFLSSNQEFEFSNETSSTTTGARGDHLYLLKLYEKYRSQKIEGFQVLEKMKKICNIYDQLKKIIHFSGGEQREAYDDMKFSRCLAKAHFLNTARLLDFRTRLYKVLTSKMGSQIHPSSTLFNSPPDVVIFYEILETKKSYLYCCTEIDENWLSENFHMRPQ